ncbi:OmpA family protein [Aeromonas bivalvium]|uniref:OmpA family protein n=1 Tax=Aeromonas bivalvium TaxID=440079 RepID=A0ABW9GKU2_9GAMM|nr:OmpA family protein [Aeromonas bivalvium]
MKMVIRTALAGVLLALLGGCAAQTGLSAEQIAMLKEQGFRLTEEGWTLDLSNRVLFANDVGRLSDQTRGTVEKLADSLQLVGLNRVRIEGHTDTNGPADYNQRLSLTRAQSVADVMVAAGMKPGDLIIQGRGEVEPIADNKTREGRAQNRRVSIVVPSQ